MSGSRALLCFALFVLPPSGCHRADEDELGMKVERHEAIALDKLTEPAQLVAAVLQPGEALDGKLGPRGFDVEVTTELDAAGTHDRTLQRIAFDADGKGGFHVVHDLAHPDVVGMTAPKGESETGVREPVEVTAQGMEAVALAGRLYVRPRYGRFVVRRPEAGELDRLRALAEQRLADDLALLRPVLALGAAGDGAQGGRATKKLRVALGAGGEAGDGWRKQTKVDALDGTLEVDAATGALLGGHLDARFTVPRDKGALGTHLVVDMRPRRPAPIVAPEAVPAPHRPRPMVERNQLLEGLAPPAGTQAARQP